MTYIDKLAEFIVTVEKTRGPFELFGLFKREDAPTGWDLVVAAPWLERGKLKALSEFVRELSNALGVEALSDFSRIVTLHRNDPAYSAVLNAIGSDKPPIERSGENLFGLPVEQAYILRARARKERHLTTR